MNIRRAILVHGFNVSDMGSGTTDKLRPFLEGLGLDVIEFDTGWRGLLMVRFGNRKRGNKLASLIRPGDVLIGHSDGCNLINMACWELASMDRKPKVACVYLNPALDKDTPLAPQVQSALVMHSKSDRVVWISRFLAFHRWGEMGRVGYCEDQSRIDKRYENCPYESIGIESPGHSGAFRSQKSLDALQSKIENFLTSTINIA